MRYPNNTSVSIPQGIPDSDIEKLMSIISEQDGIQYVGYTTLRLSRPAICLHAEQHSTQRTLSVELAKKILSEGVNHE
jgi:hypothetical protein